MEEECFCNVSLTGELNVRAALSLAIHPPDGYRVLLQDFIAVLSIPSLVCPLAYRSRQIPLCCNSLPISCQSPIIIKA